jgi:hypothetical protein
MNTGRRRVRPSEPLPFVPPSSKVPIRHPEPKRAPAAPVARVSGKVTTLGDLMDRALERYWC